MKSKLNTALVIHLLLIEQLHFERQAREEFSRKDGEPNQSKEDKAFNRATFDGRGEAYRDAAYRLSELRVMLSE